jgi:thioesterase domain-containing protein/acyl carrier protein
MLILDEKALSTLGRLKKFLIGGETFPATLAKQLNHVISGDTINMYGPTETTIWSTTYQLDGDHQNIPIGRPIANTEIYILDENLQPAPVGVPGELMIGGAGVVRGYFNRPELTAERFIEHPFSDNPKACIYRTGDLARFLPDGNIEFMGRMDHQVKIRGYRIELGEIEAVLNDNPAVHESVVTVREGVPDEKKLIAYVIPRKGENIQTAELRNFTKEKLPGYMVPSHVVTLEAFPQTPNKKIDRKALPPPEKDDFEREFDFDRPRTDIEEALSEIWAEALGVHPVGCTENFFDLGGDSLSACGVILNIRRACNVDLPLQTIFHAPTVTAMAKKLEEVFLKHTESTDPIMVSAEAFRQELAESIDAAALTPRKQERMDLNSHDESPFTPTEKVLALIWKKTLRVNSVSRNDHFFHLGGKSLDALKLFTKIEEKFGKRLPLSTLLRAPTFSQLAELLDDDSHKPSWSSLVTIQPEGSKLPLFLVHGAEGNVLLYRDLASYLGLDQPVYGLQSPGLDGGGRLFTKLDEMASYYITEIRDLQPKGPYYLGGYCLGGTVALEMARQLTAQGEQVALVAMIETYNVHTISENQSPFLSLFHILQNIYFHLTNFLSIGMSDRWLFLNEKFKVAKGRLAIRFAVGVNKFKRLWGANADHRFPHLLVKKVNEKATYDYLPKVYSGRVVAFRPKTFFFGQNDPVFGWEEVVRNGLLVRQLPFYPKCMLVEPFVKILAEELKACLEEAHNE